MLVNVNPVIIGGWGLGKITALVIRWRVGSTVGALIKYLQLLQL